MNTDALIGVIILFFVVVVILALVLWCRKIINRLDGKSSLTAREIIKGHSDES